MVVKPKAKKRTITSNKKHRFESFSERIAKLNIDPVRETNHQVANPDGNSHFRTALEEWRDLNMSQTFTYFARQVESLCQSLPQVLYYKDQIMDLLISSLTEKDEHSLEPLLALVAQFAHDLGSRFEAYFELTVRTISELASTCSALEVIDRSFNCLVWLFKYLSRLLVSDLRPLYALMASLLGKQRQKPFVSRFAAEAMSFLIRKAAARYHKDQEPLDLIVEHAFNDLMTCTKDDEALFVQGLAVMFSESAKGVGHSINSSGGALYQSLLKYAFRQCQTFEDQDGPVFKCLEGIFVSHVHHTTAEEFWPIEETVLSLTDVTYNSWGESKLQLGASILIWIFGTRKGSRISDWGLCLTRLSQIVNHIDSVPATPKRSTITRILEAIALAILYCPFELSIKSSTDVTEFLSKGYWASQFPRFCSFFFELSQERFQGFVRPTFVQ